MSEGCSPVADHLLLLLLVVFLLRLPELEVPGCSVLQQMTTQFTKLFSFILASVSDPPQQPLQPAYRMQCHSCMSGYLEDQFLYISHLYRRPLVFTEKCDQNNFDGQYLRVKNCTDACVTLRMNDKVGGRRRYGFMRGCLSDILHYNRSAVRVYEHSSIAANTHRSSSPSYCSLVRLRDLFISSDRYAFDAHDHVELCTCVQPLCNAAAASRTLHSGILFITICLAAYFAFWMIDLDSGQRTEHVDEHNHHKHVYFGVGGADCKDNGAVNCSDLKYVDCERFRIVNCESSSSHLQNPPLRHTAHNNPVDAKKVLQQPRTKLILTQF